jgi:hypothetical protein
VRVLCRPPIAAGFRLAGFDPVEAEDASEGARRLLAMLEDRDAGVVLVQDDFHDALPPGERRPGPARFPGRAAFRRRRSSAGRQPRRSSPISCAGRSGTG